MACENDVVRGLAVGGRYTRLYVIVVVVIIIL